MALEPRRDDETPEHLDALDEVPGIVIAHGGWTVGTKAFDAGLRAFIYGEEPPASPTLPFGRWKGAS